MFFPPYIFSHANNSGAALISFPEMKLLWRGAPKRYCAVAPRYFWLDEMLYSLPDFSLIKWSLLHELMPSYVSAEYALPLIFENDKVVFVVRDSITNKLFLHYGGKKREILSDVHRVIPVGWGEVLAFCRTKQSGTYNVFLISEEKRLLVASILPGHNIVYFDGGNTVVSNDYGGNVWFSVSGQKPVGLCFQGSRFSVSSACIVTPDTALVLLSLESGEGALLLIDPYQPQVLDVWWVYAPRIVTDIVVTKRGFVLVSPHLIHKWEDGVWSVEVLPDSTWDRAAFVNSGVAVECAINNSETRKELVKDFVCSFVSQKSPAFY